MAEIIETVSNRLNRLEIEHSYPSYLIVMGFHCIVFTR